MAKKKHQRKFDGVLLCHLADTPDMIAPDTSFDSFCAKCNRRVAMAPTSHELLKTRRLLIVCPDCYRSLDHEPSEVRLPASIERVLADMKNEVPNFWRKRN